MVHATRKRVRQRRQAAPEEEAPPTHLDSSQPAEPSAPAPASSPSHAQTERMAIRAVATGRWINFEFFDDDGFLFGKWIRAQGWQQFCCLNILTYPRLVREFYGNLRRISGGIASSVKGIEITLTNTTLGQIIGVSFQGIVPERLVERKTGLRCVLDRDDVNGTGNLFASALSIDMRLLHHIIGRIFIPKTGRFDFVSERELSLMYHLIQGTSINLPGLMLMLMREATERVKVLPYGMVLTRVFEAFSVSLEGESFKKLQSHDEYCDRTLHRMGYRKINGHWVHKVSGHERQDRANLSESPAYRAEPSSPPPRADVPSSAAPVPSPTPVLSPRIPGLPHGLSRYDDQMMQRIAEVVSQSVRVEIQTLSDRVDGLQAEMQSYFEQQPKYSEVTIETERLKERLDTGIVDIRIAIERLGMSQRAGMGFISRALTRIVEMMVAPSDPAASHAPSSSAAASASSRPTSRASPPRSIQPIPSQPGPSAPIRTYARSSARCPPLATGLSTQTQSQTSCASTSRADFSATLEIPSDDQS